jgi:hypothetical protein
MAWPTLTRPEVRKLSEHIRAAGYKLPRSGYSVDVPAQAREEFRSPAGYVPTRVAHDERGYFFTSWER